MLCKLNDVKALLKIDELDTTHDAQLTLLIKSVSAKIENYIGYSLKRANYVEELQSVNNRQVVYFNHFPIQSVESVEVNGEPITDFKVIPKYAKWGGLYRGNGWSGDFYIRGFTADIVSGAWEIVATYDAGYYLPDNENYVEGAEDSLPYDITAICMELVVLQYTYDVSGATGIKSHSEGGISDTFGSADGGAGDCGLSAKVCGMLVDYRRQAIA